MKKLVIQNCSYIQLDKIAHFFAKNIDVFPRFLLLEGEVGTGKTTFSRLYIEKFHSKLPFSSPTYSIVNIYDDLNENFKINHLDVYRATADDYDWIFEMYEQNDAFFLFEWASMHPELIEESHSILRFEFLDEFHRNIIIESNAFVIDALKRRLTDVNIIFKE